MYLIFLYLVLRIVYYDSLGDVDSELYLNGALMWLQEMAIEVHRVSLDELCGGTAWTLEVATNINNQQNGTDCGIHTLMNIHCLVFSMPFICCVENANDCRDRIALNILRGNIIA